MRLYKYSYIGIPALAILLSINDSTYSIVYSIYLTLILNNNMIKSFFIFKLIGFCFEEEGKKKTKLHLRLRLRQKQIGSPETHCSSHLEHAHFRLI